MLYVWIALGGALGSVARYACTQWGDARWGASFPWSTVAINVFGSFLIGGFAYLSAVDGRFPLGPTARYFVMTGVFGGFTTFSAFSLQTLELARQGEWMKAGGNVAGSVAGCLAAVSAGYLLAAAVSGRTSS